MRVAVVFFSGRNRDGMMRPSDQVAGRSLPDFEPPVAAVPLTVHVAAEDPQYLTREDVSEEILERERVDAILMDIQMPEMDGFQATAAIREKEKASGGRVPIVALTANAMRGDGERCLAQGMDAYLAKPFRIADLDRVLGEVTGAAARPV